jgi:large subunit ribosomal protein L18e
MSRVNRPPISLSRVSKFMTGKANKVAVVVGTVTNDERLLTVPKINVCALHFTETARARITQNGGQCLTFDQLAIQAPTGSNTILLRGRRTARKAVRYFGAPGTPGSKTRPRMISYKSRKMERGRGRRESCGFKV